MRVRKKNIAKDGSGSVDILAETADDMWHVLNLVQAGDEVRAPTYRKVTKEGLSGATSSEKVGLTLSIKVETVEYDQTSTTLRLKGKVCQANKWVRMGAYHTLELSSSALTTGAHKFTLTKHFWDAMHRDRLRTASSVKHKAEVAAVAISGSESSVCLITDAMTLQLAAVEAKAPSKRASSADRRDKAMRAYYQRVTEAVSAHVPLERIKALLLAGPGHFKEQLRMHMLDARAAAKGTSGLQALDPSKIVMVQAMGGNRATVQAALADPGVAKNLADTRAAGDVAAVEAFFTAMREDESRTAYSFKHVRLALDSAAVDTLLLADDLFRSPDVRTRAAYVALAEEAKGQGVSVRVVSGMHPAGQQLAMMSGVAALLRYPMPHLQDMVEEAEKERRAAAAGGGEGGAAASGAGAGGGAAEDARDVLELGRGREGAWRGGLDAESSTEEEGEAPVDARDHSWLRAALETAYPGAASGPVVGALGGPSGGRAGDEAGGAASGAGRAGDRVARGAVELHAVRRRRWCEALASESTRVRDGELSGASEARALEVSRGVGGGVVLDGLVEAPGPIPPALVEAAWGVDEPLMARAIGLVAGKRKMESGSAAGGGGEEPGAGT